MVFSQKYHGIFQLQRIQVSHQDKYLLPYDEDNTPEQFFRDEIEVRYALSKKVMPSIKMRVYSYCYDLGNVQKYQLFGGAEYKWTSHHEITVFCSMLRDYTSKKYSLMFIPILEYKYSF